MSVYALNNLPLLNFAGGGSRGEFLHIGDVHGEVGLAQFQSDAHWPKALDVVTRRRRIGVHVELRFLGVVVLSVTAGDGAKQRGGESQNTEGETRESDHAHDIAESLVQRQCGRMDKYGGGEGSRTIAEGSEF